MENRFIIPIIISIALLLFCTYICFTVVMKRLKSKNSNILPVPDKIDVSLKDVNEFVHKEFLFEFIKWIWSSPTSIDMSSPEHNSTFISDLKNPEILQKKMSAMTSLIISKMSIYLINEFNAVYNDLDGSGLFEYVSRQIMFHIRRVDMEITSMFETQKNAKTMDLLRAYIVSIESEIYRISDVEIIHIDDEMSSQNNG